MSKILNKKYFMKNLILVVLLVSSQVSQAAVRVMYFSGTSTNNMTYDDQELTRNWGGGAQEQGYALLCTIHIMNFSTTTQNVTEAQINFHTTQYIGGSYAANTDLQLITHKLYKWKGGAAYWYAGWMMQTFNTVPNGFTVASHYDTDGVAIPVTGNPSLPTADGFVLQKIDPNTGLLSNSSVTSFLLAPNSMAIFVARTWVSFVDATNFVNRKTYNLCSGMFKIQDAAQAGEPRNGSVVATGQVEYVADSAMGKRIYYGEGPAGPTVVATMDAGALVRARAAVYLGSEWQYGQDSSFVDNDWQFCTAYAAPYVRLSYHAKCSATHTLFNNSNSLVFPMHVASIPIQINSGRPF